MNGDRFLEKIGEVDERFIAGAENIPHKKSKKAPVFIAAGAAAAAAAVALSVNFLGDNLQQPPISNMTDTAAVSTVTEVPETKADSIAAETNPPETSVNETRPVVTLPPVEVDPNLEKIQYPDDISDGGGWGFEGFELKDISEYHDGNPYNENMDLRIMPVLKNNIKNPDREKMTEYLKNTVERLGVDFNSLELTAEYFDIDRQLEEYRKSIEDTANLSEKEMEEHLAEVKKDMIIHMTASVYGENSDLRVSIGDDYTVSFFFNVKVGIPLPEGYNKCNTPAQREKTAVFLLEHYGIPLQNLKTPVTNIYVGDNSIGFYDKGETDAETILNYKLNSSGFGVDEKGNLTVLWIDSTEGCEKLGDYPVISAEQAKSRLLEGHYLSSYRNGFDMKYEDIAYTEITYRRDRSCDYILPYYRFLVKLPYDENEIGFDTYAAFYVPAVSEEYFADPSISFNGVEIDMNN